jgi:methionine-S-sulfoxide reductase
MGELILGGGCFWCTEAVFSNVKGVISVQPGYSGGNTLDPTYADICTGTTGHAEVIKITYDQDVIDIVDLFSVFFSTHDPTTLNRQGGDVGTHYRSVIFYNSSSTKQLAEIAINAAKSSGEFTSPIVTSLEKFSVFYPAENYHEDYYTKNSNASYCSFVITPKLEKFKSNFSSLLNKAN